MGASNEIQLSVRVEDPTQGCYYGVGLLDIATHISEADEKALNCIGSEFKEAKLDLDFMAEKMRRYVGACTLCQGAPANVEGVPYCPQARNAMLDAAAGLKEIK